MIGFMVKLSLEIKRPEDVPSGLEFASVVAPGWIY